MPVSFSFNTVMGAGSRTDEIQLSPRTVSPPKSHAFSRFYSPVLPHSHKTMTLPTASSHSSNVSPPVSHSEPYRRFLAAHTPLNLHSTHHFSVSPFAASSAPQITCNSSVYDSRFNAALDRSINISSSSLITPSSRTTNLVAPSPFRPPVSAVNRLSSWSSPFAVNQRRLLESSLSPTLVDSAFRVVLDSLAPSTRSTYAAGILRFNQFCDSWDISDDARMPASPTLLASFVAQCRGLYAGNTVRAWLAGIRSWHIYHQAQWHGDHEWVHQARITANKEGTIFRRPLRAPVSLDHLHILRTHLDLSSPLHAAAWAVALVTFFGCRRLGETTVKSRSSFDPRYNVLRGTAIAFKNLSNGSSSVGIRIPWTKTTKQEGASIILTSRDDALCPVRAFRNHLDVNMNIPASASLFAYRALGDDGWVNMYRDTFLTLVTRIWADTSLDHVSGHSFRIGGAVILLLSGVPPEVVAATGGWTSLAFLLYWRRMEEIIPLCTSRAYTSSHLSVLAGIFESFRTAQNIPLTALSGPSSTPTHMQHPVPL